MGNIIKKTFVFLGCFILGLILHGWSALALYYCVFPAGNGLRVYPAILYAVAVSLFIILQPKHVRAFFLSLLGFFLVSIWFSSLQPKLGGIYPPELVLPSVEFYGDQVTIHNVRNCYYRTKDDFDVRYDSRTYNLKDLRTLDVMVNYWGMDAIAHTFLAYGFADGSYVDVSVEIRPEVGKVYDMLQGFFKQYQLIYIWGDERDLIRLRTNFKKETVYLYRTSLSAADVRKMFVSMLKATDDLNRHPQFYNTLTQSCTNTLGDHLIATGIMNPHFWERRVLTGDVDRRSYNDGFFVTYGLPFPELRKRAYIDERAQAADKDPDFSKKIRTHILN